MGQSGPRCPGRQTSPQACGRAAPIHAAADPRAGWPSRHGMIHGDHETITPIIVSDSAALALNTQAICKIPLPAHASTVSADIWPLHVSSAPLPTTAPAERTVGLTSLVIGGREQCGLDGHICQVRHLQRRCCQAATERLEVPGRFCGIRLAPLERVMHFARCETSRETARERHPCVSGEPAYEESLDSRVHGNDHRAQAR
jgi:hypothetical protein